MSTAPESRLLYCLGIDPGQSGGLAVVSGGELLKADKMLETDRDLLDYLAALKDEYNVCCYLESVHAFPGRGLSSTWKFAEHYGSLKMALAASSIPYTLVTPVVWQKRMGCLSHGDKNVTKRRAQQLFPAFKITHATADCTLIALYGWRQEAERMK